MNKIIFRDKLGLGIKKTWRIVTSSSQRPLKEWAKSFGDDALSHKNEEVQEEI